MALSTPPHLGVYFSCLLVFMLSTFHPHALICVLPPSFLNMSLCISYAISFLAVIVCIVAYWYSQVYPPCYLVDFCCTEAEGNAVVTLEAFSKFLRTWRSVKESNLLFQERVFLRSGIGEESYAPPRLIAKAEDTNLEDARSETEGLISVAVKRLLQRVGVDAKAIDIVVVNSSLFNPTPSIAAFVVSTLHMRSNVKTFNLAGMGCSAGLVSIGLAKDLLKVHRNSYALVISTENITRNMYFGNSEKSMMVSNGLFRCGCSAILLSSKPSSRGHAKLRLLHCLRTHLGADKKAYDCVHHIEDEEGNPGVSLQFNLVEVAGSALRANILKLARSILPVSEILKVLVSLVKQKVLKMAVKMYEPDFKKAIDHFCIHPGGRAVIDAIGKGLKLSAYDIEPGKMALYRFGNTSSSGIWYALAYCEAKGRLRKGNKIWQIALGSGFKCNSGVWEVLRDIEPSESGRLNPWMSSIHKYPVTKTLEECLAVSSKISSGPATFSKAT
ncbi:hypothetical protein GOP47_0020394 [Adiantum capillus-veneris]|uniref:3-ketoacyl-CoA synthase n=1 Tax=Adiantum capillus-veneris TaxID=13818 RepID=A0A9D4UE89_ADICA|nr:hypothetical protein GOP47_0020394 [Adiantum capillus-veneris]